MAAAVEVELLRRREALRDHPLERDARVRVVAQVLLPLLREKDLLGLVAPLVEVAAHADTLAIQRNADTRLGVSPTMDRPVGILFEDPLWLRPLFAPLPRRGVAR